eukprot:3524789-Rhodomonas_salina.1
MLSQDSATRVLPPSPTLRSFSTATLIAVLLALRSRHASCSAPSTPPRSLDADSQTVRPRRCAGHVTGHLASADPATESKHGWRARWERGVRRLALALRRARRQPLHRHPPPHRCASSHPSLFLPALFLRCAVKVEGCLQSAAAV